MDAISNIRGLIKFIMTAGYTAVLDATIIYEFKKSGGMILLIPGISDKALLSPIAKAFGLKVVWLEFAPLKPTFRRNFYFPKLIYKLAMPFTDLVISPTVNTSHSLSSDAGFSHNKIKIIPCGLPLSKKASIVIPATCPPNRREAGIHKNSKIIIGNISRLQKEKGQDTLIKALPVIRKAFPKVKLILIGEGRYKRELVNLAQKLGLTNHVEFKGFVHNTNKHLDEFTIFAFPTRWDIEGFGLVPLEAMNMGVPVLASTHPPAPEVLGNAATYADPDPDAFAKAIINLLGDKNKQNNLKQKGYKKVRQYDINKIAQQYEAEFEKLNK
jgi:glycosyltransferase involved in cell wall biosynthesis